VRQIGMLLLQQGPYEVFVHVVDHVASDASQPGLVGNSTGKRRVADVHAY
jgi:hypothetical protein